MVVNDLVTKFSFTGSPSPLSDYNDALGGSIALLTSFVAVSAAAVAGFSLWADSVLDGVDSLDQLSNETDVAIGKLQELNYIAGQSQSSSQAMESTIRSLNSTIGTAAIQGSEDFARLGISVRDAYGEVKTADQILEEVRQRFKQLNLTTQEQQHFASALGIDASLIQMLNKTDEEMASLSARARELGTLTKEQTEQAADYEKSLNSMWHSLNSVKQLVAVGVAPEMSRLAESFTQLLADNKDWIVDGIKATIGLAGDMLAAFNRLLPVIGLLTAGFVAWKIAAIGLGTVLGVIFSPIVLITAGIAGLLLLIDDLIVAFNGGKSVVADFFEEFFGIDIVPVLTGIVNAIKWLVNEITKNINWLWDKYTAIIGGISEGIDTVKAFFGFGDDDEDEEQQPGRSSRRQQTPLFGFGGGAELATAPRPGGEVNQDNRQVTQDVRIEIRTDDPATAGESVRTGLQRQLDNANTQMQVGGR